MAITIKIAKNSGYCMGVKNAFVKSYQITESYTNICLFGEIVHNKFAIGKLFEKGIILKKDLNEIIIDGNIKNVIIRAHGISPKDEKILKESGKNIFDLTCPKVKNVQLLAKDLTEKGYEIIILGKANHPEIIGICGYCNNNYIVIKSLEEFKNINIDPNKNYFFIAQTTADPLFFNEISEYIKYNFKNISIKNTLCKSPILIQEETIKLAKEVHIMLVVGDKMSANTTTLFNLSSKYTKSYFVETINNIKKIDFNEKIVGITGGSSTPWWQIEKINNYLIKKYGK